MDGAGKSQAFADALARARQLAAKLGASNPNGGASIPQSAPVVGVKRGFDDYHSPEPDAKRSAAAMSDPFGAQLAAMKVVGGGTGGVNMSGMGIKTGLGISGSGKACTEEIRIPDPLVGLIIGRGGEQINRIQAEAGCKVQLAPDNGSGQDRPCHLQGTKEAIERAKDMVMEIVSSKSHEIGSAGGAGQSQRGFGAKAPVGGPGQGQVELMIPGQKVGLIIGKGGETIRNLQDKSGTKMFILQENMFEECDKPLRIVGEPDLVEHARQLVLELINDSPAKVDFGGKPRGEYGGGGGFSGPGMETMKFPVPKVSVGLIIGKGGDMIKRIQMETGAKVQFDPINSDMGDMDEQLAIITGKSDQIRLAQLKIEELVETALYGKSGGPDGPPFHRGGGGGGDRGGGGEGRGGWGGGDRGGGGGYGKPPRGDQDEDRMTVPVGRVGMIIGKGGETIRNINQSSGAHCEIDRNLPQDGPERTFVIRGSRQQIEHAKELITEKVNTFPPKGDRRGGGSSEYGGQQQSWGGGGGGSSYGGGGGGSSNREWNQGAQGDPSKMGDAATAAQWAAYYSQCYAQPQAAASATGQNQPDYTQQWVEYLRGQGNHQQADLLEQQAKAAKEAAGSTAPAAAPGGANGNPAQAQAQGGVDYSQQWAEHYRSIGKIKEAEEIEAYIKSQKQQSPAPSHGGSDQSQAPGDPAFQNYNYYAPYGNGSTPQKPGLTPPGDS